MRAKLATSSVISARDALACNESSAGVPPLPPPPPSLLESRGRCSRRRRGQRRENRTTWFNPTGFNPLVNARWNISCWEATSKATRVDLQTSDLPSRQAPTILATSRRAWGCVEHVRFGCSSFDRGLCAPYHCLIARSTFPHGDDGDIHRIHAPLRQTRPARQPPAYGRRRDATAANPARV